MSGCTTPPYRITKQQGRKVEFNVAPERILMECEEIKTHEVLYGFMIHVLDEENTVLTMSQGNRLGKKTCFDGIKKIERILKRGKHIYIGAIGDFEVPRVKEEYKYTYPKLGTFHGNGRAFGFMAIANEHGDCYDAYYGDKMPCPQSEFPIK
ncbi:MAG: hypothetical protein SGI74_12565 [Oligoflexia bacterium]|nr:hypothetical protein [Oligoflexia bacterium]